MSEWNIYTVGSVDFLYNVLNSIAMMLNNGTYSDTFRISALLGVIGIVIASAVSGGKTLSFGQMAVCIVMYMLFFQVSARVNLEDLTTGEFRAVDNVPWGLAAPASIISTVGYSVTENMEQAFSTPAMTEYGALDPLFTLTAYYDALKDPMRWRLGTGGSNPDIAASIDSYIRTCVINDINRNATTYAHIWRNGGGVDSVRSSDASTYVVLYDGLNSNGPQVNPRNASQYTCAGAYTRLKNQAAGSYPTLVATSGRVMAAYGRCDDTCSPEVKVTNMMNFYNIASSNVRDFQLQMLMMPNIAKIPQDAYLDSFKGTAAITRAQTATQQAFQWSSGGSSFLYWMSSFMPIFQGVIYALTPFMAFLLGLGVMGLRLIMKYFLIIVWTQTWVPLAAVINLYMLTKMQSDSAAILSITSGVSSLGTVAFNQLYDLIVNTQKNIALAGNLFGLIPALGGFIVWGSSIAFNSLANSAAAPSPADTKVLAPDMTNAPALNNRSAEFSNSPMSGTTMTGASGIVGSISMQEMASSNLQSAAAKKETASQQESAARNAFVNSLASNQHSGTHSTAQNAQVSSSLSQAFGSDASKIFSYMEAHGKTATDAVADLNSVTKGGSLGVGTGSGPGVSAGATAAVSSGSTDQHGNSIQGSESSGDQDAARLASSLGAGYEKKLSGAINDVAAHTSQFGISSSEGSSYSSAYSNSQSAEKAYSEAETFSQSSAVNQAIGFDVLGKKVTSSPGLEQKMQQLINAEPGSAQQRDQYANQLMRNGLSSAEAQGAASVLALKDAGKLNEVAHELGFVNGGSSPEITSSAASQYSNVAPDASEITGKIDGIGGVTMAGVSSTQGEARGTVSTQEGYTAPSATAGRVGDRFDSYIAADGPVQTDHNKQSAEVVKSQQESAYNSIANLAPSSIAREGLSIVNNLTSRISDDNPVIQETRRQAQEVQAKYGNNSQASEAIAEYYALGKAGVTGDTLQQARDNAVAAISLDTGGHQSSDGMVHGGNREWGERAVTAIESTFERQGTDDRNTLSTVTLGLNEAAGKTLPSNTTSHAEGGSLTGARSNVTTSGGGEGYGNGASASDNEEIRIEITRGNESPDPHKRKI